MPQTQDPADSHAQPQGEDPALGSLGDIVRSVERVAQAETVSMQDIAEALGRSSFIPLLIVPALAVVTPLSGIPLFSSACGIAIALIGVQLVFHRDHVWLPKWLARQKVRGQRVIDAMERTRPVWEWIDRHARKRLTILTKPPLGTVARAMMILCGAAMPFLEFVPFSSSILGAAVLFFSVGFLTRDGLYILAAAAFIVLAFSVVSIVAMGVF